jgi:hypothetical protein
MLRVAQETREPRTNHLVANYRPYLEVCVLLLPNRSGTRCVPSEGGVLLCKLMRHNALIPLRAQQTPIQTEKRVPQLCKRAHR